jgi:hypothetical protein
MRLSPFKPSMPCNLYAARAYPTICARVGRHGVSNTTRPTAPQWPAPRHAQHWQKCATSRYRCNGLTSPKGRASHILDKRPLPQARRVRDRKARRAPAFAPGFRARFPTFWYGFSKDGSKTARLTKTSSAQRLCSTHTSKISGLLHAPNSFRSDGSTKSYAWPLKPAGKSQ